MLLFEFVRALLRIRLNNPAFVPLFQLPPRMAIRYNNLGPNV